MKSPLFIRLLMALGAIAVFTGLYWACCLAYDIWLSLQVIFYDELH
jgi:hypothetical protein